MRLKETLRSIKKDSGTVKLILGVVIGTEIFHALNSVKLNMIMPTISNILNEEKVRSWSFGGNQPFCFRYGNLLWDMLSVAVFLLVVYGIWKGVCKIQKLFK